MSSTLVAPETALSALAAARTPLSPASDPPVPAPLRSLSQPGPGERVGAVVDLALIGPPGAGKTALCHLLIRTLRARAPELGGDEAGQQRQLVAGALGSAEREAAAPGPRHAVLRLPVVTLLDGLSRAERLACYARAGMARSIGLTIVSALAVLMALSVWRQTVEPAAMGAALALLLAGALASWSSARARWLETGEIEVVVWDSSGAAPPPDDVAELHALFESLVRQRRRRGPVWRSYGFAPVLVVDPVALGRREPGDEDGAAERLRLSLPVFAALGGDRPRALVAVSRFAAVEAACRPGTDRRRPAQLHVTGPGGDGDAVVDRERIRRTCLDAEDGRDGDVHLSHLRYDAADARVTAGAGDGDRTEIHWSARATGLEGEARRALFRFLARSIDPPAVLDDRPHIPSTPAGSFSTVPSVHRRSPSANPDVASPRAQRDLPRTALPARRGTP